LEIQAAEELAAAKERTMLQAAQQALAGVVHAADVGATSSPWGTVVPPPVVAPGAAPIAPLAVLVAKEKQSQKAKKKEAQKVQQQQQQQPGPGAQQPKQPQKQTQKQKHRPTATSVPSAGVSFPPSSVAAAPQLVKKSALKKKKPMSFLEIQRAEEEEKKRQAKARKASGVQPAVTGWSMAAGAVPNSSRPPVVAAAPARFPAPGTAAAAARASATVAGTATATAPIAGTSAAPTATAVGGGPVWGSGRKHAGPPAASSKQHQQRPPAPAPVQHKAPPPPPKVAAPKPQQPAAASAPSGGGGGGGGFWELEEETPESRLAKREAQFAVWCKAEVGSFPAVGIDGGSFIEILRAMPDSEVAPFSYEYFGNSQKVREFARNFVSRRSGKDDWETKGQEGSSGKSRRKKKGKGQKVDPSLLSYGVSSSERSNRGEIDSWHTTK
jgi:hypothetical protein